ncbi:MAG: glycosyltransferase [Chthoniobacteraceae bacterium]|jgi:dolichol-phosphate mannosyltransferase
MRPESPSISVIVPTLNEAENIEAIIGRILAGAASLETEVIVVDDGSRDETQAIVRRLSETLPVTLLAREKPRDGLAGAVLAGARMAKAGVALIIDADGSHPPEKIPELALPVIRGERDMVIGSRYAPGGSTPGWSRKRRLMSRAASACAWPLTDVHDALSGFFAVRRELLAEIPPDAAGFKIALEILVRGGDSLRVGEAPIAFRDRELGQSKMGTGVILTYFRRLLALSGWRESEDTARLAMAKTGLVWAVDFVVFAVAWWMRASLGTANLLGFTAGAALNAWLKAAQLPREKSQSMRFLGRLLFVSMLALFSRSGVLGTCAEAFGWPWLVAILPAIVTGWVVLFLGYALFIWPVREQYGSGVRWRVAALGAAAYLLALRIVYLYAMPVSTRLVSLRPQAQHNLGNQITVGLANLGTRLLGPDRGGLNAPAVLCWVIGAWAAFQTAKRVFDKTTAFRALLLFSVMPVFFWRGAVFSPETVLLTVWALVLWLMTIALRWQWRAGALAVGVATAVFWWPGGWLPYSRIHSDIIYEVEIALAFVPVQLLLPTPMASASLARHYVQWRMDVRRAAFHAAAFCSIVACIATFVAIVAGDIDMTASGAIWLPLLPFIAADMDRPGAAHRWWGPTIYTCVLCYGFYFYWLAFAGLG